MDDLDSIHYGRRMGNSNQNNVTAKINNVNNEYSAYSQLSLIKTIASNLNPKLISKINLQELNNKIANLKAFYTDENSTEVLNSLKSSFLCNRCNINPPELVFSCRHQLCMSCFTSSLHSDQSVPPGPNENPIPCLICGSALEHSDYNYAFSDWADRVKLIEEYERKGFYSLIKCKICERKLRKNCFSGCNCCCFECQLDKRKLGSCDCGSRFEYRIRCDSCRTLIETPYLSGFKILCEGHLHCVSCLEKTLDSLGCKICAKGLDQKDIRKVLEFCIKDCSVCNKRCRPENLSCSNCRVCWGCQDLEFCLKCKSRLKAK